ncbi:MAG: VWA domain-containing protein [Candidatus Binatia bacterium]|nr:VWA domain-containing protein [Candidatus Binatia bacterium]
MRVREWLAEIASTYAKVAPTLAEEIQRAAAAAFEQGGAEVVLSWQRAFASLLERPALPRRGLEAFLAASERTKDRQALSAWAQAARALGQLSPHLAADFLAHTAPVLDRVPFAHVLCAHRLAAALVESGNWRGEFVARAFLESLPRVLGKLDPAALGSWCALGAQVHRPEKGRSFFAALPPAVLQWSAAEQEGFFRALLDVAAEEERVWVLYSEIPRALGSLTPQLRRAVLQVFARSAGAGAERWKELAPVVGALFAPLSPRQRRSALAALDEVSALVPAAAPELLRRLPQIYERANEEQVAKWVRCGLELYGSDPQRAQAYFGLDTRTSVDILGASPTAAVFHEGQHWLRKLAHMLSAMPLTLRAQSQWTLRPALEGMFDERVAELPDRIDFFPTHEDNVALYRLLVMQIAGRFLYGTAPQAPAAWPDWKQELEETAAYRPHLHDWFLLTEGVRVGARVAAAFPGWAKEQRVLCERFCLRAPTLAPARQPSPFDWLLAWELSQAGEEVLPEPLRVAAVVVRPLLAPLHRPSATVNDAWSIAKILDEAFARVGAGAGFVTETAPQEEVPAYLLPVDLYDGDATPTDSLANASPQRDQDKPLPSLRAEIVEAEERPSAGAPLSAELLEALLKTGTALELKQGVASDVEGLGFYISDLLGKLPQEQLQELRSLLDEGAATSTRVRKWFATEVQGEAFYYDEWDYLLNDYRPSWCRLVELPVDSDGGEFFACTLADYAALLPIVRREFQKIRPDSYKIVRGLEAGEDFDLNAVVDARGDQRARRTPSPKLYIARRREERDVAVLFLIDMSASTDEPVDPAVRSAGFSRNRPGPQRRIIDITKEALVIMAEALEELGDAYAIYGFSGHGRRQVEFYRVKSFREALSPTVRGRIGALEPKRSTRMGAALRHAITKMGETSARSRHILLLSDGFPQDFDYGQDRRSNTYGLRDTTAALQECEARGIVPFCITVDRAGHDYLREMCPQSRYLVIDDIAALPRELPKIYQRVVGS